jgi:hypothetical protein
MLIYRLERLPNMLEYVSILYVLWKNLVRQAALPLALLLARDDLERARVESRLLLLLVLLDAGATLLGDLGPATACGLVVGGAGSVTVVDNALVCELSAAEELLGKVARVEGVAGRVDGLGDELSVGRETQKGGNEVLSW